MTILNAMPPLKVVWCGLLAVRFGASGGLFLYDMFFFFQLLFGLLYVPKLILSWTCNLGFSREALFFFSVLSKVRPSFSVVTAPHAKGLVAGVFTLWSVLFCEASLHPPPQLRVGGRGAFQL